MGGTNTLQGRHLGGEGGCSLVLCDNRVAMATQHKSFQFKLGVFLLRLEVFTCIYMLFLTALFREELVGGDHSVL